jgi:hypothetical protein
MLLVLFASTGFVFSQSNDLSLGVAFQDIVFNGSKGSTDIGDIDISKYHSNIIPAFVVTKLFNEKKGAAISFQYSQGKYNDFDSQIFAQGRIETTLETNFKSYAIQLEYLERYKVGGFVLVSSLLLPFRHNFSNIHTQESYFFQDNENPIPNDTITVNYDRGKKVTTGLFYRVSVAKNLFANFDCFVSMDIGLSCEIPYGQSTYTTFNSNSSNGSNGSFNINYDLDYSYRFELQMKPRIGIQYWFNAKKKTS